MSRRVACPPADRTALLLDFDGTLVDIAPAPDLIVVPESLMESLAALRARLGDALAIVTGRTLAEIDRYLPDIPFAVAAEHGAILRHAPGGPVEAVALPAVPPDWVERAAAFVSGHEGARLERKTTGFVLHFRGCPDAGPACRAFLDGLVRDRPDAFGILSAKMAWELRGIGADKGTAVEALMRAPPFHGRSPLFVGDDVTDRHGIDACARLGGGGHFVPVVFGEPAAVRAWLRAFAAGEAAWEG